ncbi:MAG TPA: biotin/lipoyl-containing protein, partial [Rudaea sp.]|nr:biotin/lipoyl-containing protein [Rudaea sp.]
NIAFLERLVRHPAVVEGRIDTGYLDRQLSEFLPQDADADAATLFAAATAALLDDEDRARHLARAGGDPHSPWHDAGAWRLGHRGKRIVALEQGGKRIEIAAYGVGGNYALEHGGMSCQVANSILRDGFLNAQFDGIARRFRIDADDIRVLVHDGTQRMGFKRARAFAFTPSSHKSGDRIAAPMPGRVVVVKVKHGDKVEQGQELLVMEAMKMELSLKAPHATIIASVHAEAGEFIEADTILVRFGDAP